MPSFNYIYDTVLEGRDLEYRPETLPYSFDALEPFIDKETMELHYSKHYKGYIKKLNEEIKATVPIVEIIKNIKKYSDKVRNNGGGYYNHTLFWSYITPDNTSPSDELITALTKKYGSLKEFEQKFIEKALTQFGSGWCWLVIKSGKLDIITTPNQDNPLMSNLGKPLLGVDVWEHAYYKKYSNDREKYLKNFIKVINWKTVSSNFIAG